MSDYCVNETAHGSYLHVAIDTPSGRWVQADFQTERELWDWVASNMVALRERYGEHEWFKIRVETFKL